MHRGAWSDGGGQPAGHQQPGNTSQDHEMTDEPTHSDNNNQWTVHGQGSDVPDGYHVNTSGQTAGYFPAQPSYNTSGSPHVYNNGQSAGYLPAQPSFNTSGSPHVYNNGQSGGYLPAQPYYSISGSQLPHGSFAANNNGHTTGYYPPQPSYIVSGSQIPHGSVGNNNSSSSGHTAGYHLAQPSYIVSGPQVPYGSFDNSNNNSGHTAGYYLVQPSYIVSGPQLPHGSVGNNCGHTAGYYPGQPSYNMSGSQPPNGSHVNNSGPLTSYHTAQQQPSSSSSHGSNVNNNGHSAIHHSAQASNNPPGDYASGASHAKIGGHAAIYPSQASNSLTGSHASYGSHVNSTTHSASQHPTEDSYNSSGLHPSDSLNVNDGGDPANHHPSQASDNLAERRNQDPLSVIVKTLAETGSFSVTQEGDNYQPEDNGNSGKGKDRAHTGKGKDMATYVQDHPPTPPPKDSIVPVQYSGKGKGRATDVEECISAAPPKDITMESPEDFEMEDDKTFQDTSMSPTKCLISPMRNLMGVTAPQTPKSGYDFHKLTAITRAKKGKGRRVFNLFEALLTQDDITLNVVRHMEVDDFFSLYCISKKFYWVVNSNMASYMMAMARVHAPHAIMVFPYTYRRSLCIVDPVLRDHPTDPSKRGRVVPSFKWLQMLAFREAVSHDILLAMALEGHRFPHPIQEIVLKMCMMLDLPRTALRLSVIRNSKIWNDRDLFIALMFFMKLDMRLSDPIVGEGECMLSKLLLAQRSLVPLWEALRGWRLTTETELLAMIVEWDYAPLGLDNPKNEAIFGVPPGRVSSLCCEDWTPGRPVLLRPDEVILGECVRRELDMNRCFVDYMLWGYVNWRSGNEIPLPDNEELKRRFKGKVGYDDCLVEYRKALAASEKAAKERLEDDRREAELKAKEDERREAARKADAEAAADPGPAQQ